MSQQSTGNMPVTRSNRQISNQDSGEIIDHNPRHIPKDTVTSNNDHDDPPKAPIDTKHQRSESRTNSPTVGIDPIQFQTQMMAMMQLLTQSIAGNRATSVEPSRIPEPKVKDPDIFDGSTSKVNSFITECQLVFAPQPSRFVNGRTRVNYMLSLLQGTALDAARPLLEAPITPYVLLSPEAFIEYLRINYGNPDEKGSARRALKALRQTGPASAYFAEFQQYIAVLGWVDQDPIVDKAISGLKPNLKDELARSGARPETLADLMRFVIPLNNGLYEREIERKHEEKISGYSDRSRGIQSNPGVTINAQFTPSSVPNPAFSQGQPNQPGNAMPPPPPLIRGQPISAELRQYRRDWNLCMSVVVVDIVLQNVREEGQMPTPLSRWNLRRGTPKARSYRGNPTSR